MPDLNRRLLPYHGSTLPTELKGHLAQNFYSIACDLVGVNTYFTSIFRSFYTGKTAIFSGFEGRVPKKYAIGIIDEFFSKVTYDIETTVPFLGTAAS